MLADVQDRYTGDVGDFLTYGLLRVLCAAGGVARLGVIWYLVTDEVHNADGRHVTYLDPGNPIGQRLRACDPALHDMMREIVNSGRRRVASVECSRVLPASTCFYATPRGPRRGGRVAWLRGALGATRGCDAVFLDPDNGIAFAPHQHSEKYADVDELTRFAERGQSLVVYHHCDRSARVEDQAAQLLDLVGPAVGLDPLAAVLGRRGTVRIFLLLPQPRHRQPFTDALRQIEVGGWRSHLQPILR
jgi:hypothetical protein